MLFVWILIFCIILLILFVAKKMCDMAIKKEITEKYSSLIFTPDQKKHINESNEENKKWLNEMSSETEIISRDGLKLKGYEIRNGIKSDTWAIVVHGYMSMGIEMVQYAKEFLKCGYNVLIIDLRAHGQSEGTYIGMGWLDHYDLQIWIDKIIEENNNSKIILYGISMGAATVSMTTGEDLPDNVKVCIADCGYTSVWDEFKEHVKKMFKICPTLFLFIASIMSKIFAGYTFEEASSVKQVSKSNIPTLFIHGTKDGFVPYYMLNIIYRNAKCKKAKLEIENAAHAESANINPEKYWSEINKFIKEYI